MTVKAGDPVRDATLDRLAAVWARWPQQRLGQLLANAIDPGLLRVLPDGTLMSMLEEIYGEQAQDAQ